jgi:hypothetical protein
MYHKAQSKNIKTILAWVIAFHFIIFFITFCFILFHFIFFVSFSLAWVIAFKLNYHHILFHIVSFHFCCVIFILSVPFCFICFILLRFISFLFRIVRFVHFTSFSILFILFHFILCMFISFYVVPVHCIYFRMVLPFISNMIFVLNTLTNHKTRNTVVRLRLALTKIVNPSSLLPVFLRRFKYCKAWRKDPMRHA